jgi:hypothetical protein
VSGGVRRKDVRREEGRSHSGLLNDGRLVVELSIEEEDGATWACLEGYGVPEEVEAWEGTARGEKSRKATRALLL